MTANLLLSSYATIDSDTDRALFLSKIDSLGEEAVRDALFQGDDNILLLDLIDAAISGSMLVKMSVLQLLLSTLSYNDSLSKSEEEKLIECGIMELLSDTIFYCKASNHIRLSKKLLHVACQVLCFASLRCQLFRNLFIDKHGVEPLSTVLSLTKNEYILKATSQFVLHSTNNARAICESTKCIVSLVNGIMKSKGQTLCTIEILLPHGLELMSVVGAIDVENITSVLVRSTLQESTSEISVLLSAITVYSRLLSECSVLQSDSLHKSPEQISLESDMIEMEAFTCTPSEVVGRLLLSNTAAFTALLGSLLNGKVTHHPNAVADIVQILSLLVLTESHAELLMQPNTFTRLATVLAVIWPCRSSFLITYLVSLLKKAIRWPHERQMIFANEIHVLLLDGCCKFESQVSTTIATLVLLRELCYSVPVNKRVLRMSQKLESLLLILSNNESWGCYLPITLEVVLLLDFICESEYIARDAAYFHNEPLRVQFMSSLCRVLNGAPSPVLTEGLESADIYEVFVLVITIIKRLLPHKNNIEIVIEILDFDKICIHAKHSCLTVNQTINNFIDLLNDSKTVSDPTNSNGCSSVKTEADLVLNIRRQSTISMQTLTLFASGKCHVGEAVLLKYAILVQRQYRKVFRLRRLCHLGNLVKETLLEEGKNRAWIGISEHRELLTLESILSEGRAVLDAAARVLIRTQRLYKQELLSLYRLEASQRSLFWFNSIALDEVIVRIRIRNSSKHYHSLILDLHKTIISETTTRKSLDYSETEQRTLFKMSFFKGLSSIESIFAARWWHCRQEEAQRATKEASYDSCLLSQARHYEILKYNHCESLRRKGISIQEQLQFEKIFTIGIYGEILYVLHDAECSRDQLIKEQLFHSIELLQSYTIESERLNRDCIFDNWHAALMEMKKNEKQDFLQTGSKKHWIAIKKIIYDENFFRFKKYKLIEIVNLISNEEIDRLIIDKNGLSHLIQQRTSCISTAQEITMAAAIRITNKIKIREHNSYLKVQYKNKKIILLLKERETRRQLVKLQRMQLFRGSSLFVKTIIGIGIAQLYELEILIRAAHTLTETEQWFNLTKYITTKLETYSRISHKKYWLKGINNLRDDFYFSKNRPHLKQVEEQLKTLSNLNWASATTCSIKNKLLHHINNSSVSVENVSDVGVGFSCRRKIKTSVKAASVYGVLQYKVKKQKNRKIKSSPASPFMLTFPSAASVLSFDTKR